MPVRFRTWIHVPVPAHFGACAHVCARSDAFPRGNTSPFLGALPLHVCERVRTCFHESVRAIVGVYALCTCVRVWTWIHVPKQPLPRVHVFWRWSHVPLPALCTCVYASGRCSRGLYRFFWVCTPCARVCTCLDASPRVLQRPLLVVRFWACVYQPGHGSTFLYRPFSVCTPCVRVCTRLDLAPCGCTGVGRVHVPVHLWTWIHAFGCGSTYL